MKGIQALFCVVLMSSLSSAALAAGLNSADFGVGFFVDSGIHESGDIRPGETSVAETQETLSPANRTIAAITGDLETGMLTAQSGRENLNQVGYSSSAAVDVKDTIRIDASALTFSDIFNVTFTALISGEMNGNAAGRFIFRADNRLTLGGRDVIFDATWLGSAATTGTVLDYLAPDVRFVQNTGAGVFDPTTRLVSLSMNLRGGRVYDTKLTATLRTVENANFSAMLGINLDPRVTCSSFSGVFLGGNCGMGPGTPPPDPTTPVPLPASALLLLSGLGCSWGFARRRTRRMSQP